MTNRNSKIYQKISTNHAISDINTNIIPLKIVKEFS